MTDRLVSLDGTGDIPLDRAVLLVGRDPQCDAQIASLRISRRHCCLSRYCDVIVVRDLGSANGTWINGRRANSGRLRAGDELWIGPLRYRLELKPRATTPSPLEDPHEGRALSFLPAADPATAVPIHVPQL
jgi:predicted component of type VI protein secretion system